MPNFASDPHVKLSNLDLSLSKIQSMLRGCHDSSLMVSDNVLSFVNHQYAQVISPPVMFNSNRSYTANSGPQLGSMLL